MLAFRGRSKDITKLKDKLIKEDYKNWMLADHEYVWSWLWHLVKGGTKDARAPRDSRILKEFPNT
jgi:hypothetical protein